MTYTKLIERLREEAVHPSVTVQMRLIAMEAADAIEALQAENERLTVARDINKRMRDLHFAEKNALQAKLDAMGKGEPVAYRAWFDADNGARWLFTLWPEEERLDVEWEPLFAAPKALAIPAERDALAAELASIQKQEPVALEDEMLDAAISWCDSNGINVLEPEQLSSLVNSLYITDCDAAPKALEPTVLKPFTPCVCHDDTAKRYCKDKGKCIHFVAHGIGGTP